MNDFLGMIKGLDSVLYNHFNNEIFDNRNFVNNERLTNNLNKKLSKIKPKQNVKTLVWHTENFNNKQKPLIKWITK